MQNAKFLSGSLVHAVLAGGEEAMMSKRPVFRGQQGRVG